MITINVSMNPALHGQTWLACVKLSTDLRHEPNKRIKKDFEVTVAILLLQRNRKN
jgi:hypothetical protein